MPVIIKDNQFLTHTCEDCGEPAYFGVGVSFRRALNAFAAERHKEGQELMGKWYCGKHWKNEAEDVF